jgi:uncharacterized protein (TIGR03084 family)
MAWRGGEVVWWTTSSVGTGLLWSLAVEEILTDLAAQHAELDGILAGLDDSDWARPSACEGWSVADVVVHLTQSDDGAVASVEGRLPEAGMTMSRSGEHNVDDWAEVMVNEARGTPPSEVLERWRTTTAAMREAFDRCDLSARVPWVTGRLSARTLATTRLSECWIHTGDVGAAFGRPPSASPGLRHIARLAWRTLPYAFAEAGRDPSGPVAFDLTGPAGERWDLVPDEPPVTVIRGDALDLCLVAARRRAPSATGLVAEGPDGDAVLELVRTYA